MPPVIVVTPFNNKKYEIPHSHVHKSRYLTQRASPTSPGEIVLNEKFFSDMVMMNVISFLMGRDTSNKVQKIDDDEVLLATLLAADYLQIPELFDQYATFITSSLRNSSSSNEARTRLNIKDDFSFDEQATNTKEAPWTTHTVQDDNEEQVNFVNLTSEVEAPLVAEEPDLDEFDHMTVSMVVDDGTSHTRHAGSLYPPPYATHYRYTNKADIVQFVHPRKPIAPVPDDQVRLCANFHRCGIAFSTLNRKHHCRHCGRIFCGACSSKYIALPESMNIYSGRTSTYGAVKSWIGWASSVPSSLYGKEAYAETHRVCDSCFDSISEQERLYVHIQAFRLLAMELPLLKRAGTVCKNWRKAAIYCLSLLREVQYQLPTGQLSPGDKKLVWTNRYHWAGHSKWLLQLLRVVNWNNKDDAAQAVDILIDHKRKHSCWRMMCSRSCDERLNAGDALLLLNEDMPNMEVRNYAIQILETASDTEVLCFIPVLVHNLRYAEPATLIDFLLRKAMANEQICNDLFWALGTCAESKRYKRLYTSIQHRLLITLATESDVKATQLVKGQDLIAFLESIPGGVSTNELLAFVNGKIDANYEVPLPLPSDPLIKAARIEWSSVVVKQSATAPIVVPVISVTPHLLRARINESKAPLVVEGGDLYAPSAPPVNAPFGRSRTYSLTSSRLHDYKFMFKREDVRKDQVVLNIIRLMDNIIKKELKYELNVLTYRVTPTSSDSGVLEMVPNADTLFDIVKTYKNIQSFLSNKNGTRQVDEVLTTYMRSLAAWTVVTHLLGVGDRHMDNIMITESGILFHIDYGFVLGKDPKPLAPNIRMSENMIDGMGGRTSTHYSEFKNLCADIFLCLRRHTPLFFNMMMVLAKADPPIADLILTPSYLEDQLSKRFLPGHTEMEATATIQSLIDQCDTLGQYMTDFFHTHAKEKTISEGVNKVAAGGAVVVGAVQSMFSWSTGMEENINNNNNNNNNNASPNPTR